MKLNKQNQDLLELIKDKYYTTSHDFSHVTKVRDFALQLADIYHADKQILVAASLLHDLGRNKPELSGQESIEESLSQATKLLDQAHFNNESKEKILQCIKEHDQPEYKSKLLESRILKDADFLDGFGARGIMRSLLYTCEAGQPLKKALQRIGQKAKQRLDGLEFIESKRLGWQQYRLMEYFLNQLKNQLNLQQYNYPGKLIVIEGISGSGKDTQAQLISDYFSQKQTPNNIVNHPTKFFKQSIWSQWRKKCKDLESEIFLLIADRVRMLNKTVIPELNKGNFVISTRCLLDTQIYQHTKKFSDQYHRLISSFAPVPDLILFLNVDVSIAWQRGQKRSELKQESTPVYFQEKQQNQAHRYNEILNHYPNVEVIDANQSPQKTFEQIKTCLTNYF